MGGRAAAMVSVSNGFAAWGPSWTRVGRKASSFRREGLASRVRELERRLGLGER